jgi:ammonia channel protein AmtB
MIDDALDVFTCHGVGGMTGMLLGGELQAYPAFGSGLIFG